AIWVPAEPSNLFGADNVVVTGKLIELTVQLQAHRVVEPLRRPHLSSQPEAQILPHIGRVRILRRKRSVEDAPAGDGMAKRMLMVEIHMVGLLVEASRAVAAKVHLDIVVKLAVRED